jgi:mRNA interferase YafQ
MRQPVYSGQFQRDLKRAKKRGKDLDKLKELVRLLIADQPLPPHYRDHRLKGDLARFRDAHIEPDWLLIYQIVGNEVRFVRTGTHSDLFNQ